MTGPLRPDDSRNCPVQDDDGARQDLREDVFAAFLGDVLCTHHREGGVNCEEQDGGADDAYDHRQHHGLGCQPVRVVLLAPPEVSGYGRRGADPQPCAESRDDPVERRDGGHRGARVGTQAGAPGRVGEEVDLDNEIRDDQREQHGAYRALRVAKHPLQVFALSRHRRSSTMGSIYGVGRI